MQIFDEILKQYVQLAAKNTQYKNSLQSLKFNDISPASNNLPEVNFKKQISNFRTKNPTIYNNYSYEPSDIKDFYEKMEFDAIRYNRNLDSQTGAFAV